jgi:ferritin-like metal-binding protein YciE
MSEQSDYSSWERINLGSEKLKIFFLKHLDRIYSAKLHLIAKLPNLAEEVQFLDLKNAIQKTVIDVEHQITRMQIIYTLLDSGYNKSSINGLTGLIEDAFEAINEQSGESELRDLSIIFYLQNIESIEMASFQILQMAAVKLKNQHINQLLKENYEEAKADRTLLLLISSKYITS